MTDEFRRGYKAKSMLFDPKVIPADWTHDLKRIQKLFPEAVLAGGALRDLYCQKEVKDLDVFIRAHEDCDNEDEIASIIHNLFDVDMYGYDVAPHDSAATKEYELNFSRIHSVINVVRGNRLVPRPPIQIISLRFSFTTDALLSHFDFGACKIAWDGFDLHVHTDFVYDVTNKVFTLRSTYNVDAAESRVRGWRRFRYTDWSTDMSLAV